MNGILLIDKPRDWTSHDVVGKLRGILRESGLDIPARWTPWLRGFW